MVTVNAAIATVLSFVLCATVSYGMGFAEEQWSRSVGFEIGEGNVVEWIVEGEYILVTGKHCEVLVLDKYGDVMVMNPGSAEYSCASSVAYTDDHDFIYQAVNFKNETNSRYVNSTRNEKTILMFQSQTLKIFPLSTLLIIIPILMDEI